MPTPIPTPYDIIPPPPGTWIPSALTWSLLTVCFLASLAWILIRARAARNSLDSIITGLSEELARELVKQPIELERISRLARRIASYQLGVDITGLTAAELRERTSSHSNQKGSTPALMRALAVVEDLAYAPMSSSEENQLAQAISDLANSLSIHRGRRSAP